MQSCNSTLIQLPSLSPFCSAGIPSQSTGCRALTRGRSQYHSMTLVFELTSSPLMTSTTMSTRQMVTCQSQARGWRSRGWQRCTLLKARVTTSYRKARLSHRDASPQLKLFNINHCAPAMVTNLFQSKPASLPHQLSEAPRRRSGNTRPVTGAKRG